MFFGVVVFGLVWVCFGFFFCCGHWGLCVCHFFRENKESLVQMETGISKTGLPGSKVNLL